jgi:hypothetical protein
MTQDDGIGQKEDVNELGERRMSQSEIGSLLASLPCSAVATLLSTTNKFDFLNREFDLEHCYSKQTQSLQ